MCLPHKPRACNPLVVRIGPFVDMHDVQYILLLGQNLHCTLLYIPQIKKENYRVSPRRGKRPTSPQGEDRVLNTPVRTGLCPPVKDWN